MEERKDPLQETFELLQTSQAENFDGAPAIRLVMLLLKTVLLDGVNTILMECRGEQACMYFRTRGPLQERVRFRKAIFDGLSDRFKIMSELPEGPTRSHMFGKFSLRQGSARYPFETAFVVLRDGEKVVIDRLSPTAR
jgi:type II secretory ATPase GspE/PulE/Tfp pilus assembly ATPase PilB-like protein